MRIEVMKDEIGTYERYLLGLQLKAKDTPPKGSRPSQHFLRHLIEVSGRISMIVSGTEEALKTAHARKDKERIEALNRLVERASAMFKGYETLRKDVELMFQQATG
jgi:hypothetical protein